MARALALAIALLGVGLVGADVGFDFLVFTQEWPPTFCTPHRCHFPSAVVKGWNIHGLWPSRFRGHGKRPRYCKNGKPFNAGSLQPIKDRLRTDWADLKNYNSSKYTFWEHEWKEHGRCALLDPPLNSELRYFNTTLGLKRQFALDRVLENGGIVPSDSKLYQTKDILSVLEKSSGVRPYLHCSGEDRTNWIETRFCVDPQLKPIDCKESSVDHSLRFTKTGGRYTDPCDDQIKYPTFKSIVHSTRHTSFLNRFLDILRAAREAGRSF